jgi:hypothetical protein
VVLFSDDNGRRWPGQHGRARNNLKLLFYLTKLAAKHGMTRTGVFVLIVYETSAPVVAGHVAALAVQTFDLTSVARISWRAEALAVGQTARPVETRVLVARTSHHTDFTQTALEKTAITATLFF